MRRHALLPGLLCAILSASWSVRAGAHPAHAVRTHRAPAAAAAAQARTPVVVELFTAQGCASCGKANAMVARLGDRPGVVSLTWSVDYWDYLGWKDTFAQSDFAQRQRVYDKRFGVNDVYTPQIVVDGLGQTTGGDPAAVDELIHRARRTPPSRPAMEWRADGSVAVGTGPHLRGGAAVWLIRFDPRERDVTVKEGDNRGSIVPARNVVRQLVRLGDWSGKSMKFSLPPPPEEGLSVLVLVQGDNGGRVLGVLQGPPAQQAL